MSRELEGTNEELQSNLTGKESWETAHYQEYYNKVVNGIESFKVKPWDIRVGEVLKLRSREELQALEEENAIFGHWVEELHDYIEANCPSITVDEEMYQCILNNEGVIKTILVEGTEDCYWFVSLQMLEYEVEAKDKGEDKEEELPPVYSIRSKEKDPAIIEEMKKKVDKKRLKNLLSISASYGEDARYIVKKEMVEEYLDLWANAKYDFYLLFGRELTMSKEIEFEMTNKEMDILKKELMAQYPQYALYVEDIPSHWFIDNEMGSSFPSYCRYGKQFFSGRGMKLSKFFTNFLKDKEFDISLSKIMQDKKVTGTIFLSIDPYDFLTSSINQHDWKSCHRITDGEWGTGSVSYMLDDTTIISYRAKADAVYKYNFWGIKFEGNSKSFRELIYFDKDSCSIIFGRQYPNGNGEIGKIIREMLEDKVSSYLDVNNLWKVFSSKYDGEFEDIVDLHYSDVHNSFPFKFARLSNSRAGIAHWRVGSELPCLCGCGRKVDERGERAICSYCASDLDGVDDDYEDYED